MKKIREELKGWGVGERIWKTEKEEDLLKMNKLKEKELKLERKS